MMRVAALSLVLLAAGSLPAMAQQSPSPLNSQQLEGLRHFNQACRVCHTKPQMTSPQYAPVLSAATLQGSEGAMRSYIANGTERMPGFRYHFKPAEIEAIVSYLKTVAPQND
jgi:mono/diheme cytochrome c family protein